jgi:hypothetical protein
MVDTIQESQEEEMKDAECVSEDSILDEQKKSTWQMVIQYQAAVLWSAFIGLGGINWGLDVLVSSQCIYSFRATLLTSPAGVL